MVIECQSINYNQKNNIIKTSNQVNNIPSQKSTLSKPAKIASFDNMLRIYQYNSMFHQNQKDSGNKFSQPVTFPYLRAFH